MKKHITYYHTAGISFKIISEFPFTEKTFHPKFKLFKATGSGNDNITIHHHFKKFDENLLKNKKLIFSNEYLDVFSDNEDFFYKQKISKKYNIRYNAVIVFDKTHSTAHAYVSELNPSSYSSACLDSVVFFGGDHYLFSNLLSNRNGVLVHGNSMAYNNQGVLLLGPSGAGKSTLSKMLASDGFEMMGDDRTIIKMADKDFSLHGSWCHGSSPVVSNRKLLFNKIFILEQSLQNEITPISSSLEKTQKIMQSIVKPFAMELQWDRILDTVKTIISKIDLYRLRFNLNGDIGQLVKEYYE